ncbi:MAG: hypothetical protein WCG80_00695 [Spirochaetales bacterium]
MKAFAPAFLLALLVSCAPAVPPLMPKQSLFKLELGTLDDQIDLFARAGLPSPLRNNFSFYDGLVLVANGNSRKVMEFSSYGDLLTLYYNPETNPVPSLLGTSDQSGNLALNPVKNRRAFPYSFNEIGTIGLSSTNQLYVEDKVPVERRVYDPGQSVVWESRILRFSKDGQFLDFLGQEGIGGTPFPAVERLTITLNGDIVVLSRTGKGWSLWWFNNLGAPTGHLEVDRTHLPVPDSPGVTLLPQLETLYADWKRQEVQLKIDYFQETLDSTTKTPSGIQVLHSLVWIYDLAKQSYIGQYEIPQLKRERAKGAAEDPLGDRPYQFLGLNDAGSAFFLSSPESQSQRFLVLSRTGDVQLERNIQLAGSDILFAQYAVSPQGILTGFLSDGTSAEIAWWRSDKLLGSYVQTGF